MPSNTTLTGSAKTEGVKVDILGMPGNTTLIALCAKRRVLPEYDFFKQYTDNFN